MRNLSKIIVLRDKNRPLYLPLKIEKNGNSLNKFFFILKFMEKYLLNKLIFMFSKNELFISYEQCLPSVRHSTARETVYMGCGTKKYLLWCFLNAWLWGGSSELIYQKKGSKVWVFFTFDLKMVFF